MKQYKFVEFLSSLNVKPTLFFFYTNVKQPSSVTQFTTHKSDKVVLRNQQYLSKCEFSLLRPGPSSQKLTYA